MTPRRVGIYHGHIPTSFFFSVNIFRNNAYTKNPSSGGFFRRMAELLALSTMTFGFLSARMALNRHTCRILPVFFQIIPAETMRIALKVWIVAIDIKP
jgi:hypothetical protein